MKAPMTTAHRTNRKVEDVDLIRLNSLGFSLQYISDELDCHPTTVTLRLKALGIAPADTRRCFMEDILRGMPRHHLDQLASRLGPHHSIKDYVRNLLTQSLLISQP